VPPADAGATGTDSRPAGRGGRKRQWSWLYLLLAFVPAAVVAELLGGGATLVFLLALIGIVPAASLIGKATAVLAERVGGGAGALLNATFGNLTELVVGVLLIVHAQVSVLKATITGGIVSNLLLVLGTSMMVGGYRRLEQRLHGRQATGQATMMVLAVATLLLPTVLALERRGATGRELETISVVVAAVLILLYAMTLVFTHKTHRRLFHADNPDLDRDHRIELPHRWSVRVAVCVLLGGTAAAGVAAEFIARSLQQAGPRLGLTTGFLGLVVIPLVGNAAEHFSAVSMAAGDRLDVGAGIAMSSSTQLVMLLVPLFVFTGLITGHRLTLAVTPLELATLAASAILVHMLVSDARGNVLEGAQLVGLYAVFAAAAFVTRL
jgi:Ca2+:H+ antiporter